MRPKVDHTGHIEMNHAHLPPSISIQLVLLDNLYPISDLEGDLVRVLGGEIVLSVDVLGHRRRALAPHDLPSQELERMQDGDKRTNRKSKGGWECGN